MPSFYDVQERIRLYQSVMFDRHEKELREVIHHAFALNDPTASDYVYLGIFRLYLDRYRKNYFSIDIKTADGIGYETVACHYEEGSSLKMKAAWWVEFKKLAEDLKDSYAEWQLEQSRIEQEAIVKALTQAGFDSLESLERAISELSD